MNSSSNRLGKGFEIKDVKYGVDIKTARKEVSTTIEESILKGLHANGLIMENEHMAALCELRKLSDKHKEDMIW